MTAPSSNTPHFFGYGSLVHRGTHAYPVQMRTELTGWRRVWRHSKHRNVAFLTAFRAPGTRIAGLVAAVPGADWVALDARERAYDRIRLSAAEQPDADYLDLHVYEASAYHVAAPSTRHPILLSYLDTVIAGYLAEFGQRGAEAFFETTDGWDGPVLNDRTAPLYPRAQPLAPRDQGFVDSALASLSAQMQKPQETALPREGRAL